MKQPDDIDPVNLAQFENARKRTLTTTSTCPFIRTNRPVLDDGPGRTFDRAHSRFPGAVQCVGKDGL